MTSPPDKLFRQGLEHYQKPAPGSAWDRIESGLNRKRNRTPWMKVAAGLILLIVTSAAILQFNRTDSSIAAVSKGSGPVSSSERSVDPAKFKEFVAGEQLAVNSEQLAVSSRDSVVNRESSDVSREAVVKGESAGVRREAIGRREASGVRRLAVVNRESEDVSRQSAVFSLQSSTSVLQSVAPNENSQAATTEQHETSIESTNSIQVEITNEISTIDEASGSKGTSIIYTADQVNAKFLKKETPPEATPEKKNTSGIQKVIDLALDLKNEGSVLGDIRDIKNELLSINIPSNKRETNK